MQSRAWSKSILFISSSSHSGSRHYPYVCRHLHLHVLSDDLCSEKMKHKKHYNSFHPKLGYFLHLHEVLSWFDEEPSYYERVRSSLIIVVTPVHSIVYSYSH